MKEIGKEISVYVGILGNEAKESGLEDAFKFGKELKAIPTIDGKCYFRCCQKPKDK